MTITAEQREARILHIGSSDAAAILGIDPFRTAWDVWASKMNPMPDAKTLEMEVGDAIEPLLMEHAERRLGTIIMDGEATHPLGVIASHLDGMVYGTGRPVEGKSVGVLRWNPRCHDWGDTSPPPYVLAQLYVQIACCGVGGGHVQALVAGEMLAYDIDPKMSVVDGVVETLMKFHERFVVRREPPPLTGTPDTKLLRAIVREPGKVKSFKELSLIEEIKAADTEWEPLKADATRITKRREDARNAIKAMLGTGTVGVWPDGTKAVISSKNRLKIEGVEDA